MTGAVVLLYHRVGDTNDIYGLATRLDVFRDQMKYLAAACTVMALDDLVAAAFAGDLPQRAVALTFDDGYLDNLQQASPVLVDLHLPATFFVTTADLGEPLEYWWDTIARLLLEEPEMPEVLSLPGLGVEVALRSDHERRAVLWQIHAALKNLDADSREDHLAELRTALGRCSAPGPRRMHAGQLLELAARPGHTVAAHTESHLSLPAQPAAIQRREMLHCRQALEALLDRPVRALAYPFGEASAETVRMAGEAGFDHAVVVDPAGEVGPARLALPRVDVNRLEGPFDVHLDRLCARSQTWL